MIDSNIADVRTNLEEARQRLEPIIHKNGGILFLSDVLDDLCDMYRILSETQTSVEIFIEKQSN